MRNKVDFALFFANRQTVAAVKLITVWLLGLLLGGFIGSKIGPDVSSYFLTVGSIGTSFLGAVLIPMIPLLVTVVLVYLFSPDVILLTAFLKAVMFSVAAVACVSCWGSAGWLVSKLLLFSDFLSIPVLVWTWYRVLSGKFGKNEITISFVILFVIGVADYFAVAPFLCSLY